MKHVAVAAVVFVIGLILGGLGPRSQVRGLESRIAELEEQDCSGGIGQGLATMFADRPIVDAIGDGEPRRFEPPAEVEDAEVDEDRIQVGDDNAKIEFDFGDAEDMDPEEAVSFARDAMELRRTQARAALMEDAAPDEDQMMDFDDAMAEMNESLLTLAEEMVSRVESGEEVERRDAMLFAADALDVMINAEDDIQAVFDEDQVAAVEDEAVDPFSYVDPALVDMLMLLDTSGDE